MLLILTKHTKVALINGKLIRMRKEKAEEGKEKK